MPDEIFQCLFALSIGWASLSHLSADTSPNVLFVLVDALSVMDIEIETPDETFYETPHF